MAAFLVKRWFLLLLAIGLGLAALWPDLPRPATDRVDPRGLVALALFLTSWSLESRSLGRALLRPLPALWAVAISYGALPALALLAGRFLLDESLGVGLMISASVPCTLASAALWTRMAGGSEATALLVTVLTTCTSWLATTWWLVLGTGIEASVDTTRLMGELALYLVVPFGLGQLARVPGPLARTVTRHRKGVGVAAQFLIFTIMMKAAVDVRDQLGSADTVFSASAVGTAVVLCVATHVAALAGGFWGGRLLGFDRASRIAVAFACSQKTLPVALFLFGVYYKDRYPLAVVSLVSYHVGQLVVDTFIADALAHRKLRETEVPAEGVVS